MLNGVRMNNRLLKMTRRNYSSTTLDGISISSTSFSIFLLGTVTIGIVEGIFGIDHSYILFCFCSNDRSGADGNSVFVKE